MTSRRRLQLNPAFAAAHGLDESSSDASNISGKKRIDSIISQARKTGKVQAANANLTSLDPLLEWPDVAVNLSLDATWERQHVSETITLLDISDNALGEKDEHKNCLEDGRLEQKYRSLQTLRAKRCRLSLSNGLLQIKSLRCLHTLDMSGNRLTTFSLQQLPPSLRTLDLSSNQLTDLQVPAAGEDKGFVHLPHLVTLNVSENNLKSVPTIYVPSLQTLYCGNNQLSSLDFLSTASRLETLDAPHNLLSTLSVSLDEAPLVTLNLTNNRFKTIHNLSSTLVRLVLNDNSLTELSGIMNCRATLVDVLLCGNKLTELPRGIDDQCVQLKTLDLQGNHLQDLPYQLGFLNTNLQTLHLEGNPLRRLRAAISNLQDTEAVLRVLRNRVPIANESSSTGAISSSLTSKSNSSRLTSFLVGSKTLTFENKKLTELPQDVLEDLQRQPLVSKRIERLVVAQNQLNEIPDDWLQGLDHIKTLEANKNQLTIFPKVVDSTRLTELHLSCNRLANIQQLPSSLSSLQVLDLSWNRPTDSEFRCDAFPSSLRVLNLAGNKLVSIDINGQKLPASLEVLNLSDNRFKSLGDNLPLDLVAHCPNLQTLMLQNNELTAIPLELGLLLNSQKMNHLDLRGNSQRAVRYAVLEKPCSEQLLYLQNRMTPEQLTKAQQEVERRRSTPFVGTAPSNRSAPSTSAQSTVNIRDAAPIDQCAPVSAPNKLSSTAPDGTKKLGRAPFAPQETRNATKSVNQQEAAAVENATNKSEPAAALSPSLHEQLLESVNVLAGELENNRSLSQAKVYALKKQLAMERSRLIREKRRLKQQQLH